MNRLDHDPHIDEYRHELMQFLNEFGLEAPAILSMARRAEPVRYDAGEVILAQGKHSDWVYFLLRGHITISLKSNSRVTVLGERGAVTVLGEISYFNGSPATATVHVARNQPAVMLRLSYEHFTDVLETYPGVKPVLSRIGEMRMISNFNGFCAFRFFMEMIGWKRDRLAVNRPMLHYLEDTVTQVLLPLLSDSDRLLDVGDGPGITCELIYERDKERLDTLFIQASHLEDAILNPVQPFGADLSRAKYLREKFEAIVALQVFNHVTPEAVGEQFDLARTLLAENGLLLVVRLRVVNIHYTEGMTDSKLLFRDLQDFVQALWPESLAGGPLVNVTFLDADFDPAMEWNPQLCEQAAAGTLTIPDDVKGVERPMLEVLVEQARQRLFDPDALHFHWLVWQAAHHDFELESSRQDPEVGFYYQLYRRAKGMGNRRVRIFN